MTLLTVNEAATRLRITRRTVLAWITTGRLPASRPGHHWRIHADDVEALLAATRSSGGPPTHKGTAADTTTDTTTAPAAPPATTNGDD